MDNPIINKVAQSAIITLDLEKYYPQGEMIVFDMTPYLFMKMILKEKDFREALKDLDWNQYENKNVGITCSADAIIPLWAYMLVTTYLQPVAKDIVFGNEETLFQTLFLKNLQEINAKEYKEKRVVIKGCGDKAIPASAYIEITKMLRPFAKSIMYGEPCSTVPVYKAPKV